MIWNNVLGRETHEGMIDVDIEKTPDSFHVYTVPSDFEVREGDEVHLHGVPTDIDFGAQFTMQCRATVQRAGLVERAWTRLSSMFELTELYEVGFQPKDQIDNGFIPHKGAAR
jgi:hypothetical protein